MRGLVCAVVLIGLAPAVRANTVVFATGTQLLGGYTENARAAFDIDNTAHTITVYLLNLVADPTNVDQAIGSLRFSIDGAGAPIPSMGLASGAVFDINSGGVIKNVATETTNVWQTTGSAQGSGEQVTLCAVCTSGGTTGLIVGGPAVSGKYDSADPTLRGTSGAPWIIGSGAAYSSGALAGLDTSPSWVITFPTGTNLSSIVITNVIFGFGESANYGWNDITVPVETPELSPTILIGTGLGLLALAVGVRRLRRS
jgi:hypothetical protein